MASRRRLARASGQAAKAGLPPTELSNRHDPLWSNTGEVAGLVDRYGLSLVVDPSWKAWKCFDAFRQAWCEANGLGSRFPGRFDRDAALALGIDVSGSARFRMRIEF